MPCFSATSSPVHVLIVAGAPEPVLHHGVNQLAIAHAIAAPRVRQQVGCIGHRLHTSGDHDLRIAQRDGLRAERHRLQPAAADHVDGQRRDVVGEAAVERRLTRRVLAESGGQHAAHDALIDRLRGNTRAGDRRAHHDRAKLRRTQLRKRSLELPYCCSDGADDHHIPHALLPLRGRSMLLQGTP
jgi:hypothetical protein